MISAQQGLLYLPRSALPEGFKVDIGLTRCRDSWEIVTTRSANLRPLTCHCSPVECAMLLLNDNNKVTGIGYVWQIKLILMGCASFLFETMSPFPITQSCYRCKLYIVQNIMICIILSLVKAQRCPIIIFFTAHTRQGQLEMQSAVLGKCLANCVCSRLLTALE